jgi:hypothetical protein
VPAGYPAGYTHIRIVCGNTDVTNGYKNVVDDVCGPTGISVAIDMGPDRSNSMAIERSTAPPYAG